MSAVVKTTLMILAFFVVCRLAHRSFSKYPLLYSKCKWLVLAVYLMLVLYATVFSRQMAADPIIKLQLFWSYQESFLNRDWPLLVQIVLNVLMYLPFGFILAGAAGATSGSWLSWWKTGILAALFSAITELCQLVFCLGFFEFDDILHNTIGALIGYGAYRSMKFRKM